MSPGSRIIRRPRFVGRIDHDANTPLVLADSDASRLDRAAKALAAAGFHVTTSTAGAAALDHAKAQRPPVAVVEARLADGVADGKRGGGPPSLLDDLASGPRNENPVIRHITDPITSLWNAPYTTIKLAEEIKRARRFGNALSVVSLAFDGPPQADPEVRKRLLTTVAGILLCESRDIDHVGRSETDGFTLVLPQTDVHGASVMAGRVLTAVEKRSLSAPDMVGIVTMSAGVAGFSAESTPAPEDLTAHAEAALDQSRRMGGNRQTKWSPEG